MSESFKVCRKFSERMAWLCHVGVTATLSEIRVAIVLAKCCNSKTGLAFPSASTIGKTCQMTRNNVAKAIVGLRDKKLIRRAGACGQVVEWNLVLPLEPASPQKHLPASPQKHVKAPTLLTVVEPVKIKPKTQSPTLHGASADPNPWEAWGPDKKQVQAFLKISGLTNLELDDQVQEFIDFNLAKPEDFEKQGLYWKRWCRQISKGRRDVNDTCHIDVTGQDQSTQSTNSSQADLAEILQAPFECWKRVGPHVDPSKDPKKFIARGCCSRKADPCTCTVEQRKLIVERLKQCPRRR